MIEFAQPFALWTGLSICLPILAHLAYRQVVEKLPFSSLRFLRSSSIPRSGRRKPSDLLLLILRIILFILITLLLADPYWRERDSAAPNLSETKELVFLLDASSSMSGWGGWDNALAEIRSRLKEKAGDRFGLITHQDGLLLEHPIGTPSSELLAVLEELKPQYAQFDLQGLVARTSELFSLNADYKKIVVLSDFQKSSWQEISGSFAKFAIDLELYPVGHGSELWSDRTGNFSIIDARVAPGGDEKVRIWSVVRNFNESRFDLNVSILAGGIVRDTVPVNLPPQGTEQVQFILPSKDFAQATISIEGTDQYTVDNNRSLWILPPLPRKFGFWQRSSEDVPDFLEAQFLRAAMESAGDGVWDRWREDDEKAKEMRMGSDRASLDLLLVLGLSGWFEKEGLAPSLLDHLEKGGKAIITPPADSHVLMNKVLKESGIIDFTFGGMNRTAFRMEPYRFEVLPVDSKLNQVFLGDSVRDLYLSQILQFINVDASNDLNAPLQDRSGRPLILSKSFANGGRLVFFTFRILPEWTDLPMRNSFLPLIIELCDLNQRSESSAGTLRLEAGNHPEWSDHSMETRQIGLFQVGEQRIEVVHPLIESMPEVMNKNELHEALTGVHFAESRKQSDQDVLESTNEKSLWLWFASSAAILLIIEMILSSPFKLSNPREEVASG